MHAWRWNVCPYLIISVWELDKETRCHYSHQPALTRPPQPPPTCCCHGTRYPLISSCHSNDECSRSLIREKEREKLHNYIATGPERGVISKERTEFNQKCHRCQHTHIYIRTNTPTYTRSRVDKLAGGQPK